MLRFVFQRASAITGALFCIGFCLTGTSCGEDQKTPDWSRGDKREVVIESITADAGQTEQDTLNERQVGARQGVRFVCYNVENWLTMSREAKERGYQVSPKPEGQKKAVIQMIVSQQPDVVGLQEIGTAKDLAEIQERLKVRGVDLPHSHYAGGSDVVRRLGILSRFPITATAKPAELEFKLQGRSYGMNRGVLDATIRAGGKSYRFLGVHLKSKREVKGVDQAAIRLHEARLLRRHVDKILDQDQAARLIVYGDFNDTRPSRTVKTVTGNYGDDDYLTAIPFKDSRGHSWTHYWEMHDIYSRIDFVTVSKAMKRDTDFKQSYIVDDATWSKASDHRPLVAIFR